MTHTPALLVSPVGTSLLTNLAGPVRGTLFANANARHDEVSPAEEAVLLEVIDSAARALDVADEAKARKLSAELNGLLSWEAAEPRAARRDRDRHLLLATDTWLGTETARLVASWLEGHGRQVEVVSTRGLQTRDLMEFRGALAGLTRRLYEELPGWRDAGYRVVFNLTGGFKGIQGYLQSAATFLADESVYIFERSSELLRIPALPVRLDLEPLFEEHLAVLRALGDGDSVPAESCAELPSSLWEELDGVALLSPWGELLWEQHRETLSRRQLLEPRRGRVRFSPRFRSEAARLTPDRLRQVNHALRALESYLAGERSAGGRLGFKSIHERPHPDATHELRAWQDGDAKRLYGHFEGDEPRPIFVIDLLGKHL